MKKSITTILTVILAFVLGLTVLTACDTATPLNQLISDYGITLEGGDFEKGSTLVTDLIETAGETGREIVSLLKEQDYDKDGEVSIFDIFVSKDGNEVQPNGKVKITIPAPFESENGYVTFHVKDNDSVETLETTYSEGKISFETDSFSYFAVASANNSAEVTALLLDGANAGFSEGKATYTIGDENRPKPEYVIVNGVKATGNELLTKDEDYTIDLGGLDFTKAGTYTITYTYIKDATIKETLTVEVVAPKFTFNAYVFGGSGAICYDDEEQPNGYQAELTEGAKITLTAVANEGYTFKGWYEPDGTEVTTLVLKETPVSTSATYEFAMPATDYTVYAVFEEIPVYVFTANIQGSGKILIGDMEEELSYQNELTEGAKITLTAVANEGYTFKGWYEPDGTEVTTLVLKETPVSTSATYEFTMPATDYTVYAVFEEVITYVLSAVIEGEGGYFEIDGEDGGSDYREEKLVSGDTVMVKAVANAGYEFIGWYTNADVPEFITSSAEYTFRVENEDIYVKAVFEVKVTALLLDGANAGFSEGKATYTIGDENKPKSEYVIVNGVKATGNELLTKDEDYTIDLGGLDFTKAGTYTITYTYIKDATIKETLTVEVVAPKFTFSAVVENEGGSIYYDNEAQPNGYCAELEANSSVTLNAMASNDYEFIGWYTATDVPELISESAEYTFVTGNSDQYVMARFDLKILYLWNDSSNAGFNDEEKSATVTIGDTNLPIPENVIIYGGRAGESILLTKDIDYTIDLGGLDFEQEGIYTITYRHIKNPNLTTTLEVTVVAPEEPITINLSYEGSADPVKYNGGRAAYVFKESIKNNGVTCDIEELGLSYEWRDHATGEPVDVARDNTWDESLHYPSPAVVGTYDFVVYSTIDGVKTDLLTVTREIIVNQYSLVTDASLSEYTDYTVIAVAEGRYYAMSNPFVGNSEREAIEVFPDENGVISLGTNYEYVFRPYDTSKRTSTGGVCYGLRTGHGFYKSGQLILWESGRIEYTTSTVADYNVTISINADGTVAVHAPYCGGTLRLVYDETAGKYLFTAKKAGNDTRTSYPVYLYGEYTEPIEETKEVYEFYGKLSKEYDGKAVFFNVYKEVDICTEYGEDLFTLLKMETGRFVWTDLKYTLISVGTVDDEGNVTGPSEVGQYQLVFQIMEKTEEGMVWVDKLLHTFEITDPSEIK